jgi:hypothetical protein
MGLLRRGRNLFWTEVAGNLAVLTFTSSKYSGGGLSSVVPHLAVDSAAIATARRREVALQTPEPFVQPWYRSGFYVHDDTAEDWGTLDDADPRTWVRAEADLAQRVIPALLDHATDDGLLRCWTTHGDPWLSPVTQQAYVCLLLQGREPTHRFEEAMENLRSLIAADPNAPGIKTSRDMLAFLGVALP